MKELIHHYGAGIVFSLVFLESIGLPLPGEAILISAAIFAGTTQELGITSVLVTAVFGAMLGSTISFWIGDRYGYPRAIGSKRPTRPPLAELRMQVSTRQPARPTIASRNLALPARRRMNTIDPAME
jgi:membrane protein DedA with SNARE-associated domain